MSKFGASLRPTALGVKAALFWLVITGAFFGSPYTNLFFVLESLLTVLAVCGTAWCILDARGVGGRVLEVPPAPAGVECRVTTEVETRRPLHALECRFELNQAKVEVAHARWLRPGTQLEGSLAGLCRGLYEVHAATLESTWPLGILRWRRPIEPPSEIIIYPTPASLPEARTRNELLGLLTDSSPTSADHSPAGLREFRDGDDPRHIDWKATARTRKFVIKEWEDESTHGLEIVLDRRCSAAELEEALSLATALLLLARENKEPFALRSQDLSATFGTGHRPWREVLTWLAACSCLDATAPAPPATSPAVIRLPIARSA